MISRPLTARQRQVYDLVRVFLASHGYAPTLQELADVLQLKSVATIYKHLTVLEKRGYIKRDMYQRRALVIVEEKTLSAGLAAVVNDTGCSQ